MKVRMSKLLVLLLVFGPAAAQKHEFSVQEAVDYARKHNIQVKNALIGVQLQAQTNREVTAMAYPQVNATAGVTDYLSIPTNLLPGEIAGQPPGTYIPVKFGTKFNQSAGVSLQQLLFEGQVFVGLQARETSMRFAEKYVEVTEENIIANIYKIYYQLSASRSPLDILDANIARLQRLSNETNQLFQNGFAEKMDLNRIEVQLANTQTERQRILLNINNGYLGLKLLMGMPVQDTLVLTDSITESDIRSGVLDAAAYNYSNRPEYQYAELGAALRGYNIRRYKLSKLPTVSLSSSFSTNRQDNKFGFRDPWFKTSYISLNINVPIFDGFARNARIRRSELELEQSLNSIEELKQTIDRDVRQAINDYSSALATLDVQKRNMELAEQVYNQTRLKYQEGVGSNTEITSAQSDLQIAQSNYVFSLRDAINAKIDFLKATGNLR